MEVIVTNFTNPFSFFLKEKCQTLNETLENQEPTYLQNPYNKLWSDVHHGKYCAIWYNNKWMRGIFHTEVQVLIWLVDLGYYVRPDENLTYITNIPLEFKKLPSKIMEASIHGVVPLDKALTDDCEIKDVIAQCWNKGAIEKGNSIIKESKAIYFVPIALLSTKGNDVVLGDLYVDMDGVVNFIELMLEWPVHLQVNPAIYFENLSTFYTSRRKHHACTLKPAMPRELPLLTPTTTKIDEYEAIAKSAPQLELADDIDSCSGDSSTVITNKRDNHLTAEEIEEYSQMYIKVNGIEHNVLSIILNKCHDLSMCEKYKDKKSVGRATTHRSTFCGSQHAILDELEEFA